MGSSIATDHCFSAGEREGRRAAVAAKFERADFSTTVNTVNVMTQLLPTKIKCKYIGSAFAGVGKHD